MKNPWLLGALALLLLLATIFLIDRPAFLAALERLGQSQAPRDAKPKWTNNGQLPDGAPMSPIDARLVALAKKFIQPGVIANEAILTFATEQAYRDFLRNHDPKLKILDTLDPLKSVRVRYDDLSDLLAANGADVAPNYLVQLPASPNDPEGPGIQPGAVPFGGNPMPWLGVTGDQSQWGRGQRVAIIDTGIESHPTFNSGQIRATIDLVGTEGSHQQIEGHGTAVASVVAGHHPSAPGVAPAADLLNVRVADEAGNSDSFTLAKGLIAAADAGATVINISLGSFGDSSAVRDAVEYAQQRGAVIVAAAGNNGKQELTFPAAYPGVVSVGSVDANGQRLAFSNTSEQLSMSAPGYGVPAAWPGEQVIEFTGTSASAPFVSGALAALLSLEPRLNAAQAMQLLTTYSNEAGAPGYDSQYGNGILDVGRVLNRNTPGIVDAAVASHYYAGDVEGNGREILQIVVQNQGTQQLPSSILTLESPNGKRDWVLPALNPGQVVTRDTVVDTRLAELNGSVSYGSTLTTPQGFVDRDLSNNRVVSIYQPPQPAKQP